MNSLCDNMNNLFVSLTTKKWISRHFEKTNQKEKVILRGLHKKLQSVALWSNIVQKAN